MFKRCGCFIFDNSYNVLIVLTKTDVPEFQRWGIPKGKRETFDIGPLECAIRETFEETGLDLNKYRYTLLETLSYDLGVRQTVYHDDMFVIQLDDNYKNIDISFDRTELDDAKWISLKDLKININKNPNSFNSVIKALLLRSPVINKLMRRETH